MHVCELQLHMSESSLLPCRLDRGWVPGRSWVFSHHGFGQGLRVHGRLESEAIGHFHFVPDHNARSVQLVLVLLEAARLEIKDLLDRRKYLRQEASLGPGKHTFVGRLVASVEEAVFFAIMSMEVTIDGDALLRVSLLLHDLLQEIDLRMDRSIRLCPSAI